MFAVREESRGRGVGKALIKRMYSAITSKEFKIHGLHTSDFMQAAVRLYEHMGFERVPKLDFQPANDGIIVKHIGSLLNKNKPYNKTLIC